MASKNCPRPKFRSYTDIEFRGYIVSVLSPERGLLYVVKEKMVEKLCTIDQFKPTKKIEKAEDIKCGDLFIYFDHERNSYLRAYRLSNSAANKSGIRAFLIDVGREIYEVFVKDRFFVMPRNFLKTSAMAVFCQLNEFPTTNDIQLKSEFLLNIDQSSLYNFHIKCLTKRSNNLGENQLCWLVDIQDGEGVVRKTPANPPKEKTARTQKKNIELSFLDNGYNHISFPSQLVLQRDLPEPGTTLLVNIINIPNLSSFTGNYTFSEILTRNIQPEFMTLELLINDDEIADKHENLRGIPVIGEMVLAVGKNNCFNRGIVEEILDDSYSIYFVDFGYTLTLRFADLFRFPRECAALPFQAAHFTIKGMQSYDESKTKKAISIMQKKYSLVMAVVESCEFSGFRFEITASVFTLKGVNITRALETYVNEITSFD